MKALIYLDGYTVVGEDGVGNPWACQEVHTDEMAALHYLERCKANHPECNYRMFQIKITNSNKHEGQC